MPSRIKPTLSENGQMYLEERRRGLGCTPSVLLEAMLRADRMCPIEGLKVLVDEVEAERKGAEKTRGANTIGKNRGGRWPKDRK